MSSDEDMTLVRKNADGTMSVPSTHEMRDEAIARLAQGLDIPPAIISSGGWRAPADGVYAFGVDLALSPEREPEPLPELFKWISTVTYVVEPCEDYYGVETEYSTLPEAQEVQERRLATVDADEIIRIVERRTESRVVAVGYGTAALREGDDGLPHIQARPREITSYTPAEESNQ